jgi:single-strand DNA-binding protein
MAVNTRRKNGQTGEWVDKPNYFDITVWGAQGENCATYLSKGRPVAVDGRLDWHEWEDNDGNKRQGIEVIANSVQFLGSRDNSVMNSSGDVARSEDETGDGFSSPSSDVPADTSDYETAPAGAGAGGDDDIPF